MLREVIGKEFISMCRTLESETDASYSEVTSTRKFDLVKLYFGSFSLNLYFLKASSSNTPPCTLFCLYVPAFGNGRYMHLGEVTSGFDCSVFPYIENTERLKKCFDALSDIIKRENASLKELSLNETELRSLFENQESELRRVFKLNDKHFPDDPADRNEYLIYIEDLYSFTYYLPAFTVDDAYISYLKGEFDTAEKRYRKKRNCIASEAKLAAALEEMDPDYRPMPDSCFALKDYARVEKGSRMFAFAVMLGAISLMLSLSIYAVYFVNSLGTVYTYKIPWYTSIIPSIIPSFVAAFIFNGTILRLIGRERGRKLSDFNDISFGPVLRVTVNLIFVFTLAMSLMCVVWTTSDTVRFYDDKLTVSAVEYPTPWTEVTELPYDEITAVYSVGEHKGLFGDAFSSESYAIVFKSGYVLDLDGYLPYAAQQIHINELIDRYGIESRYVESFDLIPDSVPNPE